MHALTHPELEAPLLLAAALIVQAAQAVTLGRLRRCTSAATTSSSAPGPSASPCSPARNRSAAAATAAAAKRKRSAACGSNSGNADGPVVAPAAGGGAECLVPSFHRLRGLDEEEEAAARGMMEGLFPRGWLRKFLPRKVEGEEGGDDSAAVIGESWALLTRALEAKFASDKAGAAGAADSQPCGGAEGGAVAAAVHPEEFPLLLSRRVHGLVVGGLAANLMEVEVRERRTEIEGVSTEFVRLR